MDHNWWTRTHGSKAERNLTCEIFFHFNPFREKFYSVILIYWFNNWRIDSESFKMILDSQKVIDQSLWLQICLVVSGLVKNYCEKLNSATKFNLIAWTSKQLLVAILIQLTKTWSLGKQLVALFETWSLSWRFFGISSHLEFRIWLTLIG